MLEQRHVDEAVSLGDADALAEGPDRLGRVSAPPQTGERRHARVVPARHVLALDELPQLALGRDGVREVELGELDLLGPRVEGHLVEKPVVERPVVLELERADRMRHALDGVGVAVRKVVHRIDAPRVARAVVVLAPDAVHHRVAQVLVGRFHVDLRPEHVRSVGELAGAHALEEVEVLGHRPVAVGAHAARLVEAAAALAHLFERLAVDVRLARFDELEGDLVELLEVVRREVQARTPVEAEPAHVFLDGADVLVFLRRSGWCRRSAGCRRRPARSAAMPKLRQMLLAWPMCR